MEILENIEYTMNEGQIYFVENKGQRHLVANLRSYVIQKSMARV